MNTVHIEDVCRVIGFIIEKCQPLGVCNVVDNGDTTQGDIFFKIGKIFGVEVKFIGKIKSVIAKLFLDDMI